MKLCDIFALFGEESLQTFVAGGLIFNTSLYIKLLNILIVASFAFFASFEAAIFICRFKTLRRDMRSVSIIQSHAKFYEKNENLEVKNPMRKYIAKSDTSIRSLHIADSLRNWRIYRSIVIRGILLGLTIFLILASILYFLTNSARNMRNGNYFEAQQKPWWRIWTPDLPNFEWLIVDYPDVLQDSYRRFEEEFEVKDLPMMHLMTEIENNIELLKKEIKEKVEGMSDKLCSPFNLDVRGIDEIKNTIRNMLQKLLINSNHSSEDFLQYYPDLFQFPHTEIRDICGDFEDIDDEILEKWNGNTNERFIFTTEEFTRCNTLENLLNNVKENSDFESLDSIGDSSLEKLNSDLSDAIVRELYTMCSQNKEVLTVDITGVFAYIDEYMISLRQEFDGIKERLILALSFDKFKLKEMLEKIQVVIIEDLENDLQISLYFIAALAGFLIINVLLLLLLWMDRLVKIISCLIIVMVVITNILVLIPLVQQYRLSEFYSYIMMLNGLYEKPIRINELLEKKISDIFPLGTLSNFYDDTIFRDFMDACSHSRPLLGITSKSLDYDLYENMKKNSELKIDFTRKDEKDKKPVKCSEKTKAFLNFFVTKLSPLDTLKIEVLADYFANLNELRREFDRHEMKLFGERFRVMKPTQFESFTNLLEASGRFSKDLEFISNFSKIIYDFNSLIQKDSAEDRDSNMEEYIQDRLDKEILKLNTSLNIYIENQFSLCEFIVRPIEVIVGSLRLEYGLHAIIWDILLIFATTLQILQSLMLCIPSLGETIVEDSIKHDMETYIKSMKSTKK